MRLLTYILLFLIYVPYGYAAGGKLMKPADEIQRLCFKEAGIPANDPNHVVTEKELDAVLQCAERYIDRS